MNVRFFAGTRAQYDSLPVPRNPLGLYFCEDTHELFWADRLLTDGMRVVEKQADLPAPEQAADGVVYYVNETRNGYVVPHGTNKWLQTIYAPLRRGESVVPGEEDNTVTTIGAVNDIVAQIYKDMDERIADIEVGTSGSGVNAIYFAGIPLDNHGDGTFCIDRLCALNALGFIVPDNQEKIEIITKDYIDAKLEDFLANIDLSDYAKKSDIPSIEGLASEDFVRSEIAKAELNGGDITEEELTNLLANYYSKPEIDNKIKDIDIPSIDGLATELYVDNKFADIKVPTRVSELDNDTGYITLKDVPETDLSNFYNKSETETLVDEAVNKIIIPDTSNFITIEDVESKGYLTEHQDISHLVEKSELEEAINNIKHPTVDLTGYATESYVNTIANTYKYEVLPIDGAFIQYNDNEVRVNTEHVDIDSLPTQNAGDGSSSMYYYMTFRAYAPNGATSVIEGQNDKMDAEHSELAVDKFGRKYTTIWAAIANKAGNTWSKFGDRSTVDKYLGFYYNFHWYKDGELLSKEKVRVILTNDACHNDLVPDAVARRIDEKVSSISIPEVDLSDYAKKDEIPSIEGLATEEYVNNTVSAKANDILFATDKFVNTSVGNFAVNENVNGYTIAQLFAKLLGLSDKTLTPDEPEIPSDTIANIVTNKIPMYSVTADGMLAEIPYNHISLTEESALDVPTESGFYQIKDISGNVIESGYQELQADSDETYYVIALPKIVDYNTMVMLSVYDDNMSVWTDAEKFRFTCDPSEVAALCDEAGIDISHIDTNVYTVWALDDCPTGSKIRFIINE